MVHNDVKHREGEARDMTASARVTVAAGLVQHTGPATEAPVRLRSLRGRHAVKCQWKSRLFRKRSGKGAAGS